MSTGSINNLFSYLQAASATPTSSLTSTNNQTLLNSLGVNSISQQSDNSQLSPFAKLMSSLQQLQQSDPAKYQQVTQQIATKLQSAAKTAAADGDTNAANKLNQLATDFTSASKTGQLPNVQDLAQAVSGGGHHHGGHHHHVDADSGSTTSTSSSSSTTSSQTDALLAAFQSAGTQNNSLDPLALISDTLNRSGVNS